MGKWSSGASGEGSAHKYVLQTPAFRTAVIVKPCRHIYLSPHLDDAVLSCGGMIHRLSEGGHPVMVLSVFTSGPSSEEEISPHAEHLLQLWRLTSKGYSQRKAEDRNALKMIGAEHLWLDYRDSIFRRNAGTEAEWNYSSEEEVFGSLLDEERSLAEAIATRICGELDLDSPAEAENVVFYSPLGIGGHVDHQLVAMAGNLLAASGYRVVFYEDYPYCDPDYRTQLAPELLEGREYDPASMIPGVVLDVVQLDPSNVEAKIRGVRAYLSQVPVLFDSDEDMVEKVGRVGEERLWSPSDAHAPE